MISSELHNSFVPGLTFVPHHTILPTSKWSFISSNSPKESALNSSSSADQHSSDLIESAASVNFAISSIAAGSPLMQYVQSEQPKQSEQPEQPEQSMQSEQ